MKYALITITALVASIPAVAQPAHKVKAAVEMPVSKEVKLGTLSFGNDKLEFSSPNLIFSLSFDAIEDVQYAGFREKWLTLGVRGDSSFARAYGFLLAPDHSRKDAPARVNFLLSPDADLAAALAAAEAFQKQVDAVIAARKPIEPPPTLARTPTPPAVAPAPAPPPVAPATTTAPLPPISLPKPAPKALFTLEPVYYLAKKPGMLMSSLGVSGQIVFREDGVGFVFDELNKISDDRAKCTHDGAIFIPLTDLQTAFVRDQKTLGSRPTMFFVVLAPKPGSEAYTRLRPLLTEEGTLLFTVRGMTQRGQVASYFARNAAQQF